LVKSIFGAGEMLEGVDGNFAEEQVLAEDGGVVARSSTFPPSSSEEEEEGSEDVVVQRRQQQPVSVDAGRDGRPEEEDGEISYFSPANATLSTIYRLLLLHKTPIPPTFPPAMKTRLAEGDRLVDEGEVFEVGQWLEDRIVDAKLENGEDVACLMLEDGCQQLVSISVLFFAASLDPFSRSEGLSSVLRVGEADFRFPFPLLSDSRR